ncbi:MAG TPA: ATP-binding protein [Gemmatimonadaceae bacterium]|nr:ATP-binding protein [Gemmatimonadaceae bacterium]
MTRRSVVRASRPYNESGGGTVPPAPISILLVDDKPANLIALEELLAPLGQRLVSVTSGAEALRRVLSEDFDLIVLDVRMPEMDGFETAALIRQRARTWGVPIIFLTAQGDDPVLALRGYGLGAVDWIGKPCDPNVLRARVAVFVRLAQAERARVIAEQQSRETHRLSGDLQAQAVELEEHVSEAQQLAKRLERANEQLRDAVAEAERARGDAERARDEAERYAQDAEDARVAAERANRAKSDFLAVVSHELRTPLNAILGYADLLEMELAGPLTEQQRDYVVRSRGSARHLLGVVDDVLDLAKVEAGEMRAAHEVVPASTTIAEALALVAPQAAARGIAWEGPRPDRDCSDVHYTGDAHHVRHILVNLLANAVKFTHAGGRVSVACGVTDAPPSALAARSAGAEGRWAFLRVEDTGIGIAEDQLEHIFEPFVQASQGLSRQTGGTGLGLAISRRLAQLMDGELTVRSRVGAGSTFTLWLPASPVPGAAAPVGAPPMAARAAIGALLATSVPGIVNALTEQLRADPETAGARSAAPIDLEDHTATFLADIAQSFAILDDHGAHRVPLIQDGTEIQRLIAQKHGAQRRRLGWSEAAVHREFAILRREVESALLRGTAASPNAPIEESMALLSLFLREAEEISLSGFRGQR